MSKPLMSAPKITDEEIAGLVSRMHAPISRIDHLAAAVLNSHFLVEERIDSVLEALAKSPKHLEHRSAKFAQKVKWIRAFAPQGDDQSWELILAINTLRNKVAHKLDGPERAEALQKLSNELDRSFKADGSVASNPNLDDYKIVLSLR